MEGTKEINDRICSLQIAVSALGVGRQGASQTFKELYIFYKMSHHSTLNPSISPFLTPACVSKLGVLVCDQIIKSRYVPNRKTIIDLLHNFR